MGAHLTPAAAGPILAQQSPLKGLAFGTLDPQPLPISTAQPHANRAVEALSRWRRDENVIIGIHLTINRLAAGLRNSG